MILLGNCSADQHTIRSTDRIQKLGQRRRNTGKSTYGRDETMRDLGSPKKEIEIRICDTDRPSECRKIHTDEPSDRSEDRDHIETNRRRRETGSRPFTRMSRGQIIFLDTPGIHKAKNKLGEYMVNVAEHTLK